jgi:hypothetical protein
MDPQNITFKHHKQTSNTEGATQLPVEIVQDGDAHTENINNILNRNVPPNPRVARRGIGVVSTLGAMARGGKFLTGGLVKGAGAIVGGVGTIFSYAGNAATRAVLATTISPNLESHEKLKEGVREVNSEMPQLIEDLGNGVYKNIENKMISIADKQHNAGGLNSWTGYLVSLAMDRSLNQVQNNQDIFKYSISTLVYKILYELSQNDKVLQQHGAKTPEEFIQKCGVVIIKKLEESLQDLPNLEADLAKIPDPQEKEELSKEFFKSVSNNILSMLIPEKGDDKDIPAILGYLLHGIENVGNGWDYTVDYLGNQLNEFYHIYKNNNGYDTSSLDQCQGSRQILEQLRTVVYNGIKGLAAPSAVPGTPSRRLIELEGVTPRTNEILDNAVKNIISENVSPEDKAAYGDLWQFVHKFVTIGIMRLGTDIFKGADGNFDIKKVNGLVHEVLITAKFLTQQLQAMDSWATPEELDKQLNNFTQRDFAESLGVESVTPDFLAKMEKIRISRASVEDKRKQIYEAIREFIILENSKAMVSTLLPQEKLRVILPSSVDTSVLFNVIANVVNGLVTGLVNQLPATLERGREAEAKLDKDVVAYVDLGVEFLDTFLQNTIAPEAAALVPGNAFLDKITKYIIKEGKENKEVESQVVDFIRTYARSAISILLANLTAKDGLSAAQYFSENVNKILDVINDYTSFVNESTSLKGSERHEFFSNFLRVYGSKIYEGSTTVAQEYEKAINAPAGRQELENELVRKVILRNASNDVVDILMPTDLLKKILPDLIDANVIKGPVASILEKYINDLYLQSTVLDDFAVQADDVIKDHAHLNALVDSANKKLFGFFKQDPLNTPTTFLGMFQQIFAATAAKDSDSLERKTVDFLKTKGEQIVKILIAYHLEPSEQHKTVEDRAEFVVQRVTSILEHGYDKLNKATTAVERDQVATEFAKELINFIFDDDLSRALLPPFVRDMKDTVFVNMIKPYLLMGHEYFVQMATEAVEATTKLDRLDKKLSEDMNDVAKGLIKVIEGKGKQEGPLTDKDPTKVNTVLEKMLKEAFKGTVDSHAALESLVGNVGKVIVSHITDVSPAIFTDNQFALRSVINLLHDYNIHKEGYESQIPEELRNNPSLFADKITERLLTVLLGEPSLLPVPDAYKLKVWLMISDYVKSQIEDYVKTFSTSEGRIKFALAHAESWVEGLKTDSGLVSKNKPAKEPKESDRLTNATPKVKLQKTIAKGIRLYIKSMVSGFFTNAFGKSAGPIIQKTLGVLFFPVAISFEIIVQKLARSVSQKIVNYLDDPKMDLAFPNLLWSLADQLEEPTKTYANGDLPEQSRQEIYGLIHGTKLVPSFLTSFITKAVADKLTQRLDQKTVLRLIADALGRTEEQKKLEQEIALKEKAEKEKVEQDSVEKE